VPKSEVFDKYWREYEDWFFRYDNLYKAELEVIKRLLPPFENALEIGVGTGRFASALGIKVGIEPSTKMASVAKERGVEVIDAVAEELPFEDESFDFVLMVTTVCFVDDVKKSLSEIYRVLKRGGSVIVGFVDRGTPLGKFYLQNRKNSRFYKEAIFFSAKEVEKLLKEAGFRECEALQTLFGDRLQDMKTVIKEGYGEGAFVVFRCKRV